MSNPWIKAIRLRTLPLAWASLTMGGSLAYMGGYFEWSIYVLSLLTAFSLQIASNLANDYGDASSGLDGEHREGPARTIQAGLITKSQMKWAIILACLFSLGFGLWLVYSAFIDWVKIVFFVVLGLGAIIASLKYTMGEKPYGYSGWGDVFVLVFFGWVGVGGSFYLYTGQWDAMVMLPASSLGLMAVAVLNVNNIRDIESDRRSGKYSIPVRIGRENAVLYHGMILLFSQLLMVAFAVHQEFAGFQWIFLLVIPLLRRNWVGVRSKTGAMDLDPHLKQMALSTLLLVILFVLGNFANGFA
jgi:1,4-dihydroxy-2-naphthoate octaprenyltransferase